MRSLSVDPSGRDKRVLIHRKAVGNLPQDIQDILLKRFLPGVDLESCKSRGIFRTHKIKATTALFQFIRHYLQIRKEAEMVWAVMFNHIVTSVKEE